MGSLSPWHWAILLMVMAILFGAKRLPEAAQSLGKSLRIFKSELHDLHTDSSAHPSQHSLTPPESHTHTTD